MSENKVINLEEKRKESKLKETMKRILETSKRAAEKIKW